MKDPHAQTAGAGLGREGWSPAVRDGWRNCSLCCLTCTAGWGLLLTGIPGRRGIRNEEAGKPEGPLEGGRKADNPLLVAFGDRCSQYPRLWRVGSGEHNWRSSGTLGKRRRGFFFKLSEGLKWIVVLVAFESVHGIFLSALGICFLPVPWRKSPAEGAEGWSHNAALDETQDNSPKTRTSNWALTHFQSRCYRDQQTRAPLFIPYKHFPL